MVEKDSFSERIRPGNSGEVGCYTAILILAVLAIRIAVAGRGPLGVIIFVGALFIFEIVRSWIKNRLSFPEMILETITILAASTVFVFTAGLFESWIEANHSENWLKLLGRFTILGAFLIFSYLSTRLIRRRNLWPIPGGKN